MNKIYLFTLLFSLLCLSAGAVDIFYTSDVFSSYSIPLYMQFDNNLNNERSYTTNSFSSSSTRRNDYESSVTNIMTSEYCDNMAYATDDNWNTYSQHYYGGSQPNCDYFIDFKKNSTDTAAILQTRYYKGDTSPTGTYLNMSIPTSCFSAYTDKLSFYVYVRGYLTSSYGQEFRIYCDTGGSYETLATLDVTSANPVISALYDFSVFLTNQSSYSTYSLASINATYINGNQLHTALIPKISGNKSSLVGPVKIMSYNATYRANGLNFNGIKDYAKLSINDTVLGNTYTMLLRIRPGKNGGGDTHILSTRDPTDAGSYFDLHLSNMNLDYTCKNESVGCDGALNGGSLTAGLDYNIAIIRVTNNISMYVNGVYKGSDNLPLNIYLDSSAVNMTLGQIQGVQYYNGTISEIIFYKRALSQAEIIVWSKYGNYSTDRNNQANKSLFLNSNEFVAIQNSTAFTSAQWSMCYYGKLNTVVGNPIVYNYGVYGQYLSDSKFCLNCHGIAKISLNYSNWHHICSVYDGSSISNYLDGILKNTTATSQQISKKGIKIFGAWKPSLLYGIKGKVDSYIVFSKALSASEVQQIYYYGSSSFYTRNIKLINEKTNGLLDLNAVASAYIYVDNNSSSQNIKTLGSSNFYYKTDNASKMQLQLKYDNNDVITRYIDILLQNKTELRICANPENTTHYEQILMSAVMQPVILKSTYGDCVIAQDYTRFAYQDGKILKGYTTENTYYLYTFEDGIPVYLAAMDGTVQTYYHIDALQFNNKDHGISINGDTLSFKKTNETLQIYYKNLRGDSTSTNVAIIRTNTSTVVFNITNTTSPNEFYMYFDYSTLGFNDLEVFKIIVTKRDTANKVTEIIKYFTTNGSSGVIPSGIAFVIALLLTFFGLTFVAKDITLGWFGAFVQAISIGILTFGYSTWYSLLLTAVNVIILVYIVMLLFMKNPQTVG